MGALFSVLYWNRRLRAGPLGELQAGFATGDVVLFAGRGFSAYLTKVGTWSGFSNVGFLIREGPGAGGLLVCHSGASRPSAGPPSPTPKGSSSRGRVKLSRFEHYLAAGGFDVVLVRKLQHPLSDREAAEVAEFARQCRGRVMNRRVSLLMASRGDVGDVCAYCACVLACCTGNPGVERLFCSELVAGMLEAVHRVTARPSGGEYLPSEGQGSTDGRVLMSPISVRVPERGRSRRLPSKGKGGARGDGARRRAASHAGGKEGIGEAKRESGRMGGARGGRGKSRSPSPGASQAGRRGRQRGGDGHGKSLSVSPREEAMQPS